MKHLAIVAALLLVAGIVLIGSWSATVPTNPDGLPVIDCSNGDFHRGRGKKDWYEGPANPALCQYRWCKTCGENVCVNEEQH